MSLYATHERTLRAGEVKRKGGWRSRSETGGVITGKYGCPASWAEVVGVTLDQRKCPGGRWHHYEMRQQLPLMGNFKVEGPSGPHEMSFMTIACTPASLC